MTPTETAIDDQLIIPAHLAIFFFLATMKVTDAAEALRVSFHPVYLGGIMARQCGS